MTTKTEKENNKELYIESVGRRKTSVARVRMIKSSKNSFSINGKSLEEYFPTERSILLVKDPFSKSKITQKFKITSIIKGGGINSQAEALRHGISRGLIKFDPELRKILKQSGFLKRDPRVKERRKFGLKKARKAPQWSKR